MSLTVQQAWPFPHEVSGLIFSELRDTQDLKSCNLVCKGFQEGVRQAALRILSQLHLEGTKENAFNKITALDHLVQKWMEKPDLSRMPSGCPCCNPGGAQMAFRAALCALLLQRLPHFSSLFDFCNAIADPTFQEDLGFTEVNADSLVYMTQHLFRSHPASQELQTLVLNSTANIDLATRTKNLASVKFLLSRPEAIETETLTKCLDTSASKGDPELFDLFLMALQSRSEKIDVASVYGTALHGGSLAIIKRCQELGHKAESTKESVLIAAGGDLELFCHYWDRASNKECTFYTHPIVGSLAHMAAANNRVDVLGYLVDRNCPLNTTATHQEGFHPLHNTVSKGCLEAAGFLLDHGAEVNATNNRGLTPLWMACFNGQLSLVTLLLQRGADANLCDENGHSPLLTTMAYARNNPDKPEEANQLFNLILSKTSYYNKYRCIINTHSLPYTLRLHTLKSLFF